MHYNVKTILIQLSMYVYLISTNSVTTQWQLSIHSAQVGLTVFSTKLSISDINGQYIKVVEGVIILVAKMVC